MENQRGRSIRSVAELEAMVEEEAERDLVLCLNPLAESEVEVIPASRVARWLRERPEDIEILIESGVLYERREPDEEADALQQVLLRALELAEVYDEEAQVPPLRRLVEALRSQDSETREEAVERIAARLLGRSRDWPASRS